jgi:hypothetical protein
MLKLCTAWILALAIIIIGARKLYPSNDADTGELPVVASKDATVQSGEDAAFYQNAAPRCADVLVQFLSADTLEASNQFVFSPVSTVSRMAHFHSLNSIPKTDPASLVLTGGCLLDLPGEKALEAHWKTADGKTIDTVFRLENDEWRLDWEHYARYSDQPWALFLAGTGPDEAEFRLLARERLAEERKNEGSISIVLYPPRFGYPHETGSQSPEFLVSRQTRDGKLLDAAFKLERDGGRLFGSTLPVIDPDDMIRVRVKVRRAENEEGKRYEITAVKACHWLSLDDPGVPLDAPVPELNQEPR